MSDGLLNEPMWALAAGCVPDADPWDIPRIAKAAGFASSGMWVDPNAAWQGNALKKTRQALAETRISLIDVEAAWLESNEHATDNHKIIVEAGHELGARNLLVVSRHDDYAASVSQFREICELAGDSLRVALEFGEFTSIKNLAAAKQFISDVSHPAGGILIDLMHINRSGDALPELDEALFPYLQACDFQQSSAAMTGMDYITAAVDGRCPLGEGEARRADIEQACRSVLDISLEIRSKPLRDEFPDPYERAVQIFNRCNRQAYC